MYNESYYGLFYSKIFGKGDHITKLNERERGLSHKRLTSILPTMGGPPKNLLDRSVEGLFSRRCPEHKVLIPDNAQEYNDGKLACPSGHRVVEWEVVRVL